MSNAFDFSEATLYSFAFYNITALDFIVDLYTLSTDFINPAELLFSWIIYKGHLYEAKSSAEGIKKFRRKRCEYLIFGGTGNWFISVYYAPLPKKNKVLFSFF